MDNKSLSDQDILAIEERQLHKFLTDVRPVGEQKSELYPEPQLFQIAFMTIMLTLPALVVDIQARGGLAALGQRMRRVLARATALHVAGLPFAATWGREMWLEDSTSDPVDGSLVARIEGLEVTDADVAAAMRFFYELACVYRQDGKANPSDTNGLGTDYRILPAGEARAIVDRTRTVDVDTAGEILGLWAAVRSLSFVMESEARDALMMHGPYDTGTDGEELVIFECNDLRWSLFPSFPIPGGQRWELPNPPFPHPNLAVALVLRNSTIEADRMGTLYVDPWQPENVVAAALLTRGTDEFSDGELVTLDIAQARALRRACDDIQEAMFLQIAAWEPRQRLAAGHFQKLMIVLRILSGAGANRAELVMHLQRYFDITAKVWEQHFERIFNTPAEQLQFYSRLNEFVSGRSPSMFTPYRQAATG